MPLWVSWHTKTQKLCSWNTWRHLKQKQPQLPASFFNNTIHPPKKNTWLHHATSISYIISLPFFDKKKHHDLLWGSSAFLRNLTYTTMVPTIHPEPDRVLFPWLMAIIQGRHPEISNPMAGALNKRWVVSSFSGRRSGPYLPLMEGSVLHDLWVKSCETWDILNINGWTPDFKKHQQYPGDSKVTFWFPSWRVT